MSSAIHSHVQHTFLTWRIKMNRNFVSNITKSCEQLLYRLWRRQLVMILCTVFNLLWTLSYDDSYHEVISRVSNAYHSTEQCANKFLTLIWSITSLLTIVINCDHTDLSFSIHVNIITEENVENLDSTLRRELERTRQKHDLRQQERARREGEERRRWRQSWWLQAQAKATLSLMKAIFELERACADSRASATFRCAWRQFQQVSWRRSLASKSCRWFQRQYNKRRFYDMLQVYSSAELSSKARWTAIMFYHAIVFRFDEVDQTHKLETNETFYAQEDRLIFEIDAQRHLIQACSEATQRIKLLWHENQRSLRRVWIRLSVLFERLVNFEFSIN